MPHDPLLRRVRSARLAQEAEGRCTRSLIKHLIGFLRDRREAVFLIQERGVSQQ
jgi:hypothetical protein